MGVEIKIYVERFIDGQWWFAGDMKPAWIWHGFEQARLESIEDGGPEDVPFEPEPFCTVPGSVGRALYLPREGDPPSRFALRGEPEGLSAEIASDLDRCDVNRAHMTWMTLREVLEHPEAQQQLWYLWGALTALDDHAAHRLVVVCSA